MTSYVNAGDLQRYVSVQQRDTTTDAYGGEVTTWTELKKVYASIEGMSGQEKMLAQGVYSTVTHLITVRYDAALWLDPKQAAAYRIVYNNRIFNLVAVTNVDEDDRLIEIMASEGVNNG